METSEQLAVLRALNCDSIKGFLFSHPLVADDITEILREARDKRYRVYTLVWFETHETMISAIAREKAIKEWKRQWKLKLIERLNSDWRDLYSNLL